MMKFMDCLVPWLVGIVGVMVIIPFYTLLERKVLGYIQLRKGPNKVGVGGLIQPVGDGLKLVVKGFSVPSNSNQILFFLAPLGVFLIMLLVILSVPGGSFETFWSLSLYLCIVSASMYFMIGVSWSSFSKYSGLSTLRVMAQVVSYEVAFVTLLSVAVFYSVSFSWDQVSSSGIGLISMLMGSGGLVCFVLESNRAPFDFAEGESELVSGFNTEYSSFIFALLFLGEYGLMGISSILMGSILGLFWMFWVWGGVFLVGFLWLRGALPRFRFDLLMEWVWMSGLLWVVLFSFMVFC